MDHRRVVRILLSFVLTMCLLTPLMATLAPAASAASATYRALLIGNNAYKVSPLRGCINDARAVRSALQSSASVSYARAALQTDLTVNGLQKAFADLQDWGIKSGDVTVVFYSGHGYRNADTGETGIVGIDHKKYSFKSMESALSKLNGTVVVMIDSCYSGGAIGKSVSSKNKGLSEYNRSIHDAFAAKVASKSMTGSKFHVITAASARELSFESGGNGYFTTGITEAMGWNATTGKKLAKLEGDEDGDGQLTVGEAYAHARDVVRDFRDSGDQNVQVSPAGSKLVLVARKVSESTPVPGDGDGESADVIPTPSGVPMPSTAVIASGQALRLYTSQKVSWKSSNASVAAVGASGLVVAKKKGKATISAKKNGKTVLKCALSVMDATRVVSGVSMSAENLSKRVGQSVRLTVKVSPSGAYRKAIKWYSSNKAVATVDGGVVKARKAGSAKIYAISSSGVSDVCTVSVSGTSVSRVQQKKAKASVAVGKKLRLSARALPAQAENRKLVWKSSDPSIAKVDKDTGVVTGLRAGKADITATAADGSGKSAKCRVTVKKKQ